MLQLLVIFATFGLVALASHHLGNFLARLRLPLITGFLLTGLLAGPHLLGVLPPGAAAQLRVIDEVALAFIAFAAGAELYLVELRARWRSIRWITGGQVVATFALTVAAILLLADHAALLEPLTRPQLWAFGLLAGAVLIARSPSSAIAVINELRARGPFTRMTLGVTMVTDVAVILLFAFTSSIAVGLVAGDAAEGFNPWLTLWVVGEIFLAAMLGHLVGRLLPLILRLPGPWAPKAFLLLGVGFGIFRFSGWLREVTHQEGGFEVFLEPLLISMVAGFTVTNFTAFRTDFRRLLDTTGAPIYVLFFTLAGASFALDTLPDTWALALLLLGVRMVAIFLGSWLGGTVAGDPPRLNRIAWMSFITQAGIGLGLSKEVAAEFEGWGASFATLLISVIILNQLIGPPLFKAALYLAGEARLRAGRRDLKGVPTALLFGLEGESRALARRLAEHGWRARIVSRKSDPGEEPPEAEVEIVRVESLSLDSLKAIDAGDAQVFVLLLGDEENLEVCELAYQHFGTRHVVVRSGDPEYWDRYHDLGVTVVDPRVAMVGLLDHFVRSPSVASLVLGTEQDQDVVDVEITNPDLDGMALRDLKLPHDTLVLSVRRHGASLISHGYTRLRRGDTVTVVGSHASLEQVSLQFGG